MSALFDPKNKKIGYKYTQSDQKHSKHSLMPTDFEQLTAFIPLVKLAFAEQAYEPTEADVMGAAKNLARLQTPTTAFAELNHTLSFDELLNKLAHV